MYGQDIFTLQNTYLAGRRPPSVNIHWRKFAISSIPLDDTQAFDAWLNARWVEKDALLEFYNRTGRFPADDGEDEPTANGVPREGDKPGQRVSYIETEVRPNHPLEFLQIFVSALAVPLIWKPIKWGWWAFKLLAFIISLGYVRI
jgi:lysocardiolipin and lysophospholipid acyltransferase